MAKQKRTREAETPQERPQDALEGLEIVEDATIEGILVSSSKGIITTTDIQRSIYEYMQKLHDPELLYSNKPLVFNGLLEHIYSKNIKPLLPDTIFNNYQLLDDIFTNVYINLCYSFSYVPLVTVFTNHLVHIDISNIYSIKDGIRFNNQGNDNNNYYLYKLCLKWLSICDSDLFTHIAHTGSIGGMFLAKVKGYSDQPQNSVQITIQTPRIDEKQIEALAAGQMPELPQNMP